MKKTRFQWKRFLALMLAVTMVMQNCMITSAGGIMEGPSVDEAQVELDKQRAAEEAARKAAEEAAKQSEAEAARQAEEAARQQSEAEAVRQAEAAARQSEAEAARQAEEAAKQAEAEAAAKAQSEAEAAAQSEAAAKQSEAEAAAQSEAAAKQSEADAAAQSEAAQQAATEASAAPEIQPVQPEGPSAEEAAEPKKEEKKDEKEAETRENTVTFDVAEGAKVLVDGREIKDSRSKAKDGKIVFTVKVDGGYELVKVLVDGVTEARKNDETPADDDYIIEGIQTDATVVSVQTKQKETEANSGYLGIELSLRTPEMEGDGSFSVSVSNADGIQVAHEIITVPANDEDLTETVVVGPLPFGSYTVTQASQEAYDVSYPAGQTAAIGEGNTTADGAAKVQIANQRRQTHDAVVLEQAWAEGTEPLENVEVDVLCDGAVYETLELNAGGDWKIDYAVERYDLEANSVHQYSIVERVPEGYVATYNPGSALNFVNGVANVTITTSAAEAAEQKSDKKYVLQLTHVLNTGTIGSFQDTEEVALTADDFVDGAYDVLQNAIEREGMVVTTPELTVTEDDFYDYGSYAEGAATIEYDVAEGYRAVRKTESGIMLMAVYQGKLDDVEFVQVNEIPVTINFVYDDDTLAAQPDSVAAERDNESEPYIIAPYTINKDSLNLLDGDYNITVSVSPETAICTTTTDENGNTVINASFPADFDKSTTTAEITVTYTAKTADYTIEKTFEGLTPGKDEIDTETRTGVVGRLTDVQADPVEGFTPEDFEQKIVTADGTTVVEIFYKRNEYTLSYDSMGGSFVEPKTGYYQQEVQVYTEEAGGRVLTCGKEEHGHSRQCGWSWDSLSWQCGKEAHNHTNSCYTNTPHTWIPIPTKQGYTFTGWYMNKECTEKATPEVTLEDDVTVYAGWEAADVNYTVVYWKEEVTKGKYEFAESVTGTAKTGDLVSGVGDKSYDYYHFAYADQNVGVKADGSTVVNVYYDRNVYTLHFKLNNTFNNGRTSYSVTAELNIGGNTYKDSEREYYTIKARLGEDISSVWPTAENVSNVKAQHDRNTIDVNFYAWVRSKDTTPYVSKRFELTEDMLDFTDPSQETVYTARYSQAKRSVRLHYMLQNADDNQYEEGTNYSQTVITEGGFTGKDIYGFDRYKDHPKDSEDKYGSDSFTDYYFYYNRKTYSITFYYADEKLAEETGIRFGANITNYNSNEIKRPNGLDDAYEFEGWYTTPECYPESKYVFDKMPAGNLVLYAKWTAPDQTVILHYQDSVNNESNPGGHQDQSEEVEYNSAVEDLPTSFDDNFYPGHTFLGWYTDSECTERYVGQPITKKTDLYAKWNAFTHMRYTVKYVAEDGTPVADPKSGTGKIGSIVKEKAKTGVDLYPEYAAYVPTAILQELKISRVENENVITFTYIAPEDLKYNVIYQYESGGNEGHNYKQFYDQKADMRTFRIAQDKEIAKELHDAGYAIREKIIQADLAEETTYTFHINPIEYDITYDLGLEGAEWEESAEHPNTYTVEDEVTVGNPTKDGYEFAGWEMGENTEQVDGEHNATALQIDPGTKGDLTFKATWRKLISVTVEKVWEDDNNRDGIRPESVDISLSNGNPLYFRMAKLNAQNKWKQTWRLPQHSILGAIAYEYVATENSVPVGYEATYYSETDEEGNITITVTNKHEPAVLENAVTVTKDWEDAGNQDGIRPESVSVQLQQNGSDYGDAVTLNEANSWSYSWSDLPKYVEGEEAEYTVAEPIVADGYTSVVTGDAATGFKVTNTHTPNTLEKGVTVTKVWSDADDQDGIRPDSVTVQLQQNNVNYGEAITLNEANSWTYTWTGLPEHVAGQVGADAEYTVAEPELPEGYTSVVTGDAATGFTVTNTHAPNTLKEGVKVTKVWSDANNQDGIRPDSVSVQLKQNGEDYGEAITLNEANGWTHTWTDLPENVEGKVGVKAEYTVAEPTVAEGYISVVTGDAATGFTVTNTHTPNTLEKGVKVSKVWNDAGNQDNIRPESVSVQLKQNGSNYGAPVTLNAGNGWSYTWENLPKNVEGEEGIEAIYTVAEPTLPEGYTSEVTGDVENGFTITNTHTASTLGDVTVTKVWNDADDQDGIRPESVSVQLLQGNKPYGDAVELNASNGWAYTWTGLPVHVEGQVGVDAVYTVAEPELPKGYTSVVTGNAEDGFTVTNTHDPEPLGHDIIAEKKWDDAESIDDRPGAVKVQLLQNEVPYGEVVTLDASNKWQAKWSDLPKNADGETAEYTVTEVDVPEGYEAKISGNVNEGFIVTNHRDVDRIKIAKAADNQGSVNLNNVITYTLTVQNTGNTVLHSVTVNDDFAGKDGFINMTQAGGITYDETGHVWIIESLGVGEEKTITYTYKVSEDDIVMSDGGYLENEATATVTVDGEVKCEDKASLKIPIAPRQPELAAKKELTNTGSGEDKNGNPAFKVGETAEFDITVTNTGNTTQKDVVVTEQLENATIIAGTGYTINEAGQAVIAEIKPGATVTVKAEYTVTQADIDNDAELKNVALVDGEGDTDPKPEKEIPEEKQNPGLTATKELTNSGSGENGAFKATETATFEITVKNEGNTTQKGVVVTEQLAGAKIVSGDGYIVNADGTATIGEIPVGESVTVKAEYTVTQKDIDSDAELKNIALVEGDNGTDPDPTPEVEIPEEEKKPGLTAEKTLTNSGSGENGAFKANETATFEITVKNEGNTTQENVVVTEQLTGAKIVEGEGYTINEAGQAVIAEMAPGATVTVKAEYKVTQDDIDSDAELKNVALVDGDNGTDPDPEPEIPIPEEDKPGLTATKTLTNAGTGENGAFKANETAIFDITVTNSGNTTQTNVTVSEQLAGATIVEGEGYTINKAGQAVIEKMAPGATVTVKAEYMVTQDDIDNDAELINSALVDGDNGTEPDPEPEVEIPEEDKPSLTAAKELTNSGSGENGAFKANETATFDITVTNSGNTTQENVVVTEQLTGATIVEGDGYTINEAGQAVIAEMAPGATVTVKAEYTVTQKDIDSDIELKNVALVKGNNGEDPDPTPEVEIPEEPKTPGLTATKSVTNAGTGENGAFKANETATFDITVTNSGNITQKNVTVTEQLAGATIVAGEGYEIVDGQAVIAEMAPGATVTVKAVYTVTQADIDNKAGLKNVALVNGEGDTDPEPKVDIPEEDKPGLSAKKELTNSGSGENGAFKANETATFDITVTNSGNTTQKNVTVTEQLTGATIVEGDGYTIDETGQAVIAEMVPGATVTVKAAYTVTQKDIDSDTELKNIALVEGDNGTDPDPEPEIPIPEEEKKPGLTATKTLTNAGTGENGAFKANETATFDITVTNSGNTTQTNVTVSEQLAGATIVEGTGYTIKDGKAVIEKMAPGDVVVVKATYKVTQEDIDSDAELKNIAKVEGDNDGKPDPEPEVKIPEEPKTPGLTATKTLTNAGTGENGGFKAGETAEFDITVTNSGNTTQTNVTVSEQLAGATIVEGTGYTIEEGKAVIEKMAPGDVVVVKATYTVTQADIDSDAQLANIALVEGDNGTDPDPEPEIPIPEVNQNKSLSAVKTVTNAPEGGFKADDIAKFDITITNTGNTTQENVVVTEKLAGATIVAGDGYKINEAGEAVIEKMAPNATVVVKATYKVTQADIDSDEKLKNIATIGGGDPTKPVPDPEVEIPKEPKEPGLTASKTVTNAPEGGFKAGETAEFNITVTNTGNTTQSNVIVEEQLENAKIVEGTGYTINDAGQAVIAEMAPNATVVVKATYTVTQEDIDSDAKLTNIAKVGGEDGPEPGVDIPEEPKKPGLTASKTLTNGTNEDGSQKRFKAGETAEFAITVTNSGNTTQTNVTVSEMAGATIVEGEGYSIVDGKAVIAEMAPNDVVVVKATYTVTQADIDSDEPLKNVATVKGDNGDNPDPEPETEIPEDPKDPKLTTSKTLANEGTGENGAFKAGETAEFNITVTNSGNTTQKNVTVTEQLAGATIVAGDGYSIVDGQAVIAEMAPGDVVVVKATYTVTQEDIDSDAKLINSALVDGDNGTEPDPTPETEIPEDPKHPALTTSKTLTNAGTGKDGGFKAGETAEFDITVTNSGNTTQENVVVTEQLSGAAIKEGTGYTVNAAGQAVIAKMAPGATVTVKAEYTVTQDDIDSDAQLANIALVEGDNGDDPDPTPTEPIPEDEKKPGLTTSKTLANEGTGADGAFKAGETAIFDITVTNSGNTTQKNVVVTEQLEKAEIVPGDGYTVNEAGQAVIAEMEPNDTVVVKATYTVTQEDIDSDAQLTNSALVEGDNGEEPDPTPEVEIPEEPKNPALTSTKELTNAGTGADGAFKAGETAEFDITVTNSGNTTQTDVTVTEQLADAVIVPGDGYEVNEAGQAVIAQMKPDDVVVVKATYTVTQADIDSDAQLANIALVEGDNGEDPDPTPTEPIPEEPQNPADTVAKTVTGMSGEDGEAVVGDVLTYVITVANTGNVTLNNLAVSDVFNGAPLDWNTVQDLTVSGSAEQSSITFADGMLSGLAVGETATITYTYTVQTGDTELTNTAAAGGSTDETTTTVSQNTGVVNITKLATDLGGNAVTLADATFYVTLFTDEAMTQMAGAPHAVTLANVSQNTVAVNGLAAGTYYLAETDAAGVPVTEGTTAEGTYNPIYPNAQQVTVSGNPQEPAAFTVENVFSELTQAPYLPVDMTVTKNVVGAAGGVVNSSETFYVGIFKDEAHTLLATPEEGVYSNIVAIPMGGSSSASATATIQIPEDGTEVKLYVAEVTADGTPVEKSASFGYTPSIAGANLVLSAGTGVPTVTVTNTQKDDGSKKPGDEDETEKSEETTEVTTETETEKETSTDATLKAASVKTGDDTPILPLVMLLAVSALIVLLIAEKRRRDSRVQK